MLVTEKIVGVLLAALAVQLVLDGLHSGGVIPLWRRPLFAGYPASVKSARLIK